MEKTGLVADDPEGPGCSFQSFRQSKRSFLKQLASNRGSTIHIHWN